jgi:predicted nuclease of predicted toxin-antitoxin system
VKLLLDHCVPWRLGSDLTGHEVSTASQVGMDRLRNGMLLRAASESGFDAVITVDQNLRYQQNLETLPVAVAVLCSVSNDVNELRKLIPRLLEALAKIEPCTLIEVR